MHGPDALRRRFLRPRKRGEPLVIFLSLLMIWMGGRGLAWRDLSMKVRSHVEATKSPVALPVAPPLARSAVDLPAPPQQPVPSQFAGRMAQDAPPLNPAAALPLTLIGPLPPLALPQVDPMGDLADTAKVQGAVAQQMLYLAVMARLPLPSGLQNPQRANRTGQRDSAEAIPVLAMTHDRDGGELVVPQHRIRQAEQGLSRSVPRWSGDGWLLMRQGGDSHALAGGSAPYGPTYGANQVGAVLRYRLIPGEVHKLSAYTRGYGALNGTGEREVAAGLSLRPIPKVPVIAMAEMRASQFQSGQVHARPTVSLVSDMYPIRLGGRLEADTYVQAGYVGGAASTPFIDGQLRVEHVLDQSGRTQWRMGIGAWGGAQQGVNRLDVGPTLRVGISEGRVGARLAFDYRLRVQGNAMPASGPSITLSAGF